MKKYLTITAALVLSSLSAFGSAPLDFLYVKNISEANAEYDEIQDKLSFVVELLNKKGDAAFPDVVKFNEEQKGEEKVFVIDPQTGRLLVAPPAKLIGKDALKNAQLNGKAIAEEGILKAYTKLYGSRWETWANSVGSVYNKYFTKIALTTNGKVYVAAVGKTDLTLQKLFIEKLVDKAYKIVEAEGLNKALTILNKPKGMFRFDNTYIFIYEILSDSSIKCIYNPTYKKDEGKDIVAIKSEYAKEMLDCAEALKSKEKIWIRSEALDPETQQISKKDIFIRLLNKNGKRVMIGSGVYLGSY